VVLWHVLKGFRAPLTRVTTTFKGLMSGLFPVLDAVPLWLSHPQPP
jgi:hypothetical protein